MCVYLYHDAWDNAWREVEEKHKLLAESLEIYDRVLVRDHDRVSALAGQGEALRLQDRLDYVRFLPE